MNARQKAKKLKQENLWLKDQLFPKVNINVTRIPTERYKAKVVIPKQIAREDGMPYIRMKLAQQMAKMLEENIKVKLYDETMNTKTYCSEIFIAFDV